MNGSRFATLQIRTPEGVTFSIPLAGPLTRSLAWGLDAIIIIALSSLVGKLINLFGWVSPDGAGAVMILTYFFISIGYGMILEWFWRGQTVGKRILRLRVMDESGLRLKFAQVAIRNLLRFVDYLPIAYLVGGLACLFSRKAQRLGDFAASTVVVRQPKLSAPDLSQLDPGRFNSLRPHAQLAARLRQRVSPAEAAIALNALVRRNQFEPAARLALFARLADHFRAAVDFPAEATDGLSDEQYVRNIADLLYS